MTDDVTLYLGDCLDVLRDLPDGSVDAVVTDPPWMGYETGRYDASAWHKPIEYLSPTAYAADLYRLLRDDTAVVLWCRWDVFSDHAGALVAAGFTVRNCIVWAKPNHTAGDLSGNLGNKHEMAVFAVKGKWRRHEGREVNVWEEPHLFSRGKRDHPTEKPVNLMARAVRLVGPEGATVLDPFMGSGTTGVACVQTGRKFIGVEIDPTYYAIAERRIAETRMQLPLPMEAAS
jgi:site-specific DNA-methyltransferase (adenine-specific)